MYEPGTEVYGFKYYNDQPRTFVYLDGMDKYIEQIGIVVSSNSKSTSLTFATGNRYAYPTDMIEDHLVDKDPEIDLKELLTQIKSL